MTPDFTDPRTRELFHTSLAALSDRINDDVNALGPKARDREEADRLKRHRDDLNGILAQMFGDPDVVDDEDTDDVPDPVRRLARYLCSLQYGWPPTHPYCGSDGDRAYRGDPGHCWVCAVVGHVVAHPERGCGDVKCESDHADDDGDMPQQAVTVPPSAAGGPLLTDMLPPPPPLLPPPPG